MSVATETEPEVALDDEALVQYGRRYRLASDGTDARIDIFADDESGQACWRITVAGQVLDFALDAEEARQAALATSPDIVRVIQAATRLNLSFLGDEARVTRRSQTRLISIWPILAVHEALAVVQRSAHQVQSATTWKRLKAGHPS